MLRGDVEKLCGGETLLLRTGEKVIYVGSKEDAVILTCLDSSGVEMTITNSMVEKML